MITSFTPMNLGVQFMPPLTHCNSRSSLPLRIYCQSSDAHEVRISKRLPPGPWKLPLIGNLHNLVGSLPHHALRDLAKEYGPLMHLQLGEISAVVVSSPKMAKEVLKTYDAIFAQRPELLAPKIVSYNMTDIAFSKGEYWKQMRKVCITELLSPKRVQSFSSIREDEVSNLLRSIQSYGGTPFNFTEKIFALTNIITSRAAFGDKCKHQDAVISLTKEAISLNSGFDLADLFPSVDWIHLVSSIKTRLEKNHEESAKVLDEIIKEHKESIMKLSSEDEELENEDLLHVLLRLQGSGSLECPITNGNIKAVIWDIFAAGTDTSSTTVEWAMAEMLKNPRVMEKAQAEVRQVLKAKEKITDADIEDLTYLKMVVKETLRLHPPAPLLLPREGKETCEIDGYEIPVKSKVIVNAFAIQRDPEYWQDPEKFIPERFANKNIDYKGTQHEYIPFGAGRRICPGVYFGLANIELPLAQLLYHFDWKLPFGVTSDSLDMTEAFGGTVGRKNHLYLIATPHKPSNNGNIQQKKPMKVVK